VVCQFVLACPTPTPHDPIAWSYHLGAWDGVGTARTTQSGCYGPEKLSRPAGSTELRRGSFLPVPSRGTRWHRWVRVSNRHAARAIAGNSMPREGLSRWEPTVFFWIHQYRALVAATDHQYQVLILSDITDIAEYRISRFWFSGPSSVNTSFQLVLGLHFLVHCV
jgi:hypothetical protein